jgi:hypothetical protein
MDQTPALATALRGHAGGTPRAGIGARVLMAAMTSAFAAGQVAGPLLVAALTNREGGFAMALVAASLPLFLAACLLFQRRDR